MKFFVTLLIMRFIFKGEKKVIKASHDYFAPCV